MMMTTRTTCYKNVGAFRGNNKPSSHTNQRNLFTISQCNRGTQSQHHQSLHEIQDHKGQVDRSTSMAMSISLAAIDEAKEVSIWRFVQNSQVTAGLLSLQRGDQRIACRMLVEETWRHNCALTAKKQKDQQLRRLRSSFVGVQIQTPPRSPLNQRLPRQLKGKKQRQATIITTSLMKSLLDDVDSLMGSDVWGPEPVPQCTERHPYLFTVNEVQKLNLFAPSITMGGGCGVNSSSSASSFESADIEY